MPHKKAWYRNKPWYKKLQKEGKTYEQIRSREANERFLAQHGGVCPQPEEDPNYDRVKEIMANRKVEKRLAKTRIYR